MYGIIARTYKFYDVHLLYSIIYITHHAARWMPTQANVSQGSSRAKRAANFNLKLSLLAPAVKVKI